MIFGCSCNVYMLIFYSIAGLNVESFGTVPRVYLPGPNPYSKNIIAFEYGTAYKQILQNLKHLNSSLYV